jgi:hypothetical protein
LKRIFFISLVLLATGGFIHAQTSGKAVGVRVSFGQDEKTYAGAEFSFQSDVGRIGRRETDIGWWASSQWDVLKFTGIRQWKAVNKERFHAYGGVGFGAGYIMFPFAPNDFFATALVNIGVDYTFGFPIQIALDWRPEWTIINNFGTPLGYDVGFAIRFAF